MRVLVTGATGFVGSALLQRLAKEPNLSDEDVRVLGRRKPEPFNESHFYTGEINADADYSEALSGVDVVVHCAARVHIMNEQNDNALTAFRAVNTLGTMNLANQAAKAGVKRFVFVSSIKVNGEETTLGAPFTANDTPNPCDAYGVSKYEAEQALKQLSHESELEVVIVRPPLVYGPGVKANFNAMMKLAKLPMPLPFGSLTSNQRSLVFVENLVDLLATCMAHPKAAGQTFLASDDHDLSTANLLKQLRNAYGRAPLLLPIPEFLFRLAGKLPKIGAIVHRLCGSLQVDISTNRELLDWTPPVSVEQAFKKTVGK